MCSIPQEPITFLYKGSWVIPWVIVTPSGSVNFYGLFHTHNPVQHPLPGATPTQTPNRHTKESSSSGSAAKLSQKISS